MDSASDRIGRYAQGGMPLAAAVKLWPTPCATDHKEANPLDRRTIADDDLPTRVLRMWPTPTATADHQGVCTPTKGREGGTLVDAVSART